MAHFFQLCQRTDEVAKQYFAMTQDASDNRAEEMRAVIKCQSVYRASKVRERWHALLHNCKLVQRVARGWLARVRTKAMKLEHMRLLNAEFFHHCSAVVQKFFRGWWSRRHLHDYYGRKRYLAKIEKRGDWTTQYLRQEHEVNFERAKQEEERHMKQEFDNLAGELHHLVSTKTIAGVYNPPYNDMLPRAFDKPIEQHLRDSCKVRLPASLRRPKHRVQNCSPMRRLQTGQGDGAGGGDVGGPPQDLPDRKPHRSRSASVGKMQKIQGPFRSKEQIEVANANANTSYKTIQASSQYAVVDADRKMQQKLSKLTRVSPVDFMAPGMPVVSNPPASVHAAVPYRDRPVELRSDYAELPKIRDKPPFFTAMPRDKHFEDYNERHLLPHGAV